MNQNIERINGKGYRYIKTTFQYAKDKDFVEKTISEATERSRKVNVHSPRGKVRSSEERKELNIGGMLAEEAFQIYVDNLIKSKGLKAKLIPVALREESIEQIGTQIDFILEVNGKQKTIEVRSSFSYLTTLPRLFGTKLIDDKGAFSIIGWYQTQNKPLEEKKDYYIFAIHHYHPTEIEERCKSEVTVYIAGAASKETLEKKGDDDNLKQQGAMYRIINPLISVPDPIDVINEMLEI